MHDPVPASEWRKFLTDSEKAIRGSAPVEPTARERIAARPREPGAGQSPVGELWSDDTKTAPQWRSLDTRSRLRRVGRIVTAGAALALLLALFSCLPRTPPGLPTHTHDTTPRQNATADDRPRTEDPSAPTAGSSEGRDLTS